MKKLDTWAGRGSFQYEGSVNEGTKIYFGADYEYSVLISSQDFIALLANFKGRDVNIGTSRTDPPNGSVGEWLMENVTKTAVASYVGPILIHEGYAEKEKRPYISFRSL